MKDGKKESDYQKWLEFARREAGGCNLHGQNSPCVRISNHRYAKDATLEDRLTLEDKQLLKQMGITL